MPQELDLPTFTNSGILVVLIVIGLALALLWAQGKSDQYRDELEQDRLEMAAKEEEGNDNWEE